MRPLPPVGHPDQEPISDIEILELRKAIWSDGVVAPEEAERLFDLNDRAGDDEKWSGFFVEALTEYCLSRGRPRGHVTQADADWLEAHIVRDGIIDSLVELELVAHLLDRAASVPDSLKRFALATIEQAVLSGSGPTRDGTLDSDGITEGECALLRRFIFAAAGDGPAQVSRTEAEMLFRIKDASLGKPISPAFEKLFVQGVANHLMAHNYGTMPTAERELEIERPYSPSVGGFFSRLGGGVKAMSDPVSTIRRTFHDEEYRLADRAAAEDEDHAVTPAERHWLDGEIEADHNLDAYEKALLAFLEAEKAERPRY